MGWKGGEEDGKRYAGEGVAQSAYIVARGRRGGIGGADGHIRRASLSVPRCDARHRFPDLQDLLRCAAADRRAAKTETVLERRRSLPRAASRRHRPRLFPKAKPGRRVGELQWIDRSAPGTYPACQDTSPARHPIP